MRRPQIDEAGLDAYLNKWAERNLGRWLKSCFMGTVGTIAGLNPTYCSIVPAGETAAVGSFLVLDPTYQPTVGDPVECMWRDDKGGYVLGPILGAAAKARVAGSAGTADPGNTGGVMYLQDTGASPNSGGGAIFGALQGFFAGIKGLLQDGNNNSRGDLAFYVRRATTDASLSEVMRLDSASGLLKNIVIPRVRCHDTGNQSTNSGTFTAITFNSNDYDSFTSMHSTSTNTSRITISVAGKYRLTAGIKFAANATGNRAARFLLNGATVIAEDHCFASTGGTEVTSFTLCAERNFAATDFIEVQAFQSSGGALNVITDADDSPNFAASWFSL